MKTKAPDNRSLQFLSSHLLFISAVSTLMFSSVVDACPTCKEALFDPSQLQAKLATAKGYAMSIGLLLSVPALLVGGVVALVVRAHRRQRSNVGS